MYTNPSWPCRILLLYDDNINDLYNNPHHYYLANSHIGLCHKLFQHYNPISDNEDG